MWFTDANIHFENPIRWNLVDIYGGDVSPIGNIEDNMLSDTDSCAKINRRSEVVKKS